MKKTLLFLVTEDWYFCSHRLPIACAARDQGYRIVVVTRVREHAEIIKNEGFDLVALEISRGSLNPFRDFKLLINLIKIFHQIKPEIIHNVALKPILYGSLAGRLCKVPIIINAFAGMGFLFTQGRGRLVGAVRYFIKKCLRWCLKNGINQVIVQNDDDQVLVRHELNLDTNSVSLICGSGVDINVFRFSSEPIDLPVRVTVVSRMLWDKGIGELIEASRLLKSRGVNCVITLVGCPDDENPASISCETIEYWVSQGLVEWWGQRNDIDEVWKKSHIAILPSYREGLPKSLLEAAASGRPIVATDIAGCRQLIKDGENGLLVPVKNSSQLADAIETLINDRQMRNRMGLKGREVVERCFSQDIIAQQTLNLYETLQQRAGLVSK